MQRFVETANFVATPVEMTPQLKERVSRFRDKLHEAGRVAEAADKPNPSVWEVPISRYDHQNVNGRVYPRSLWEKVVSEQRHLWEGSPMLADHPSSDSDGSPEKICGIWLEARVADDGYVYGRFVPSGTLGRDLQEHLVNGLKAGTSSSGFGELKEDNMTVDPNTFQIERLSDWVLAPSQGTYFTYEAATHETKNSSEPRVTESTHFATASYTEERKNMATMSKLEEKKFRRDMEAFLESAEKLTNPQERLREFEEILSFLADGAVPDLKEAIEARVNEEREKIKAMLENAQSMEEDLGVASTDHLKERLEYLAAEASVLQEEGQDWAKVAELLQKKLLGLREEVANRPTEAYVNRLKKKISNLQEQVETLEGEKGSLKESLDKASERVKLVKASVRENLESVKAKISERAANWEKKEERLSAQIFRLQKKLVEATESYETLSEEFEAYREHAEAAPKIEPRFHEKVKGVLNFQETSELEAYWADLTVRHGESILPYKQRILGAKTYREASMIYMKILPLLEDTTTVDQARIPESVSLSLKERGQLLEAAGAKIDPNMGSVVSRMPAGWK